MKIIFWVQLIIVLTLFISTITLSYSTGYNFGYIDGKFDEIRASYEDIKTQEDRHKRELKECQGKK